MKIELHSHDERPRDVTSGCGALSYSHTTSGGGAQATLYIPLHLWGATSIRGLPVRVGQWLVIRDKQTNAAHWWGRVTEVTTGREVAANSTPHGVRTVAVSITAQTWMQMLSAARMILAPALRGANVPGAVYQFKSWAPAMKAWMQALKSNEPGELLAKVFSVLAKQPLPDSLGGETLGDAVPVVWTEKEAPDALQRRFLPVPGYALQAFGNVLPSGTVWGMIQGTFGADPQLVELYPGVYPGKPTTALEKALGVCTPLVYRMAPLHPNLGVLGQGTAAANLFQKVPKGSMRQLAQSDVLDWRVSWSDSERKNGFYAETYLQPQSQMGAYGILGSPIIDTLDAELHGLRFFEASWPFFPSTAEDGADTGGILAGIDAVVEYAAHVLQDSHLKGRGSLSLRPDAFLRPGDWVSADVGAEDPWSCYINSVSHSVNVNPDSGLRTDTTSAEYVMGFFGRTGEPTPLRPNDPRGGVDVDFSDVEGLA